MRAALPYAIAAAPLILVALILAVALCKTAARADHANEQRAQLQAKVAKVAREGGTLRHNATIFPLVPILEELDEVWTEEPNVEIKHRAAGGWISGGRPSDIPRPGPRGWGGF